MINSQIATWLGWTSKRSVNSNLKRFIQNEVVSWLAQIQVIPNRMTCILLWNSFGSYWPPLYFFPYNGSQRNQNCLVNNIFQNIFFYVPHTSLEWCEWVMRDHRILISGGTIPQHFEHFLTQSYCMASKYILCVCVWCVFCPETKVIQLWWKNSLGIQREMTQWLLPPPNY